MRLSMIFAAVFLLGFMSMGYMHERVHVEIYKGYGINSTVEYFSHFPHLVTIAEKKCPTEECELAHNINEAISYPLNIFYIVLMIAMFFILIILERRESKNEHEDDYLTTNPNVLHNKHGFKY